MQEEALKFAQCMRSHGVAKFPDPGSGGGFDFQVGSGIDRSSPAFKAAQATCGKLLPAGPTPGQTHPPAKWLAQMVEAAQCMRRHGISGFPDPTTTMPSAPLGGNGVISDIGGAIFSFPQTIDTQSRTFVRAATACKFPLHNH